MNVLSFIFGILVLAVIFILVMFYLMFKFDKMDDTKKNYTKVYDLPKKSNKKNGGTKNVK